MSTEYPLSLVIKSVDQVTAPLRAINAQFRSMTAPVRQLNNSFRALSAEAGIPRLFKSTVSALSALKNVGSSAWSLGWKIATSLTAAGYGIYRFVDGSVEAASTLSRLSERLGLTVDDFARLRYSAGQADVEQEEFNDSLDQFSKRMGEARAKAGPLYEFLGKVSPTLRDQVLATTSNKDALYLMAGAFQQVTDPAKRAALTAEMFGKSSKQMGMWLGQGVAAIEAQGDHYIYLAGSQKALADSGDVLEKSLKETRAAFEGMKNAAMVEVFPALTKLARAFTEVLVANRAQIVGWAKKVGEAIWRWVDEDGPKKLTESIASLADTLKGLVDAVGGPRNALIGLGVVMSSNLLVSTGSLIASLWKLGAVTLPMVGAAALAAWPSLANGAVLISNLAIAAWGSLVPSLGAAATSVWGFTTALLANPITWFAVAVASLAAAGYAIYKNWEPLKELFSDIGELWGAIKATVGSPLESIKYAGSWYGKNLFGGGSDARPALGVAPPGAPPAPPSGPASAATAQVTVNFANMPKGARAVVEPGGTTPVNLDMGYALTGY